MHGAFFNDWREKGLQTIKNIFPLIYDFENLFNAYKKAIKCKRYRTDVMEYTDRLEENLIELQNEFIWKTYSVGQYNIFYVYEPKKRMIMSLQFKDRVAQHAIYSQINPYFEKQFINDSYACREGKGTHRAIKRLQNWLRKTDRKQERFYYLKLDISKYFYRVDHEILMGILQRKIADKDLLHVLSVIINCEDTHFGLPLGADVGNVAYDELLGEVGLPIGNLTSQMFANLYLNELDQHCKHKLRLHYYIRYMDDIIILHHDKKYLEEVKRDIAGFLEEKLHLQLNNKTCIRPTSMGIEFVGFRVWSTHIKLRKKTAKKMEKRLKYLFTAYAAGEVDRETLDRSIASYRGVLKHFESYGLRQKLNKLYLEKVGKPYKEKEAPLTPENKPGWFCGYYGSIEDYAAKEVKDNADSTDD